MYKTIDYSKLGGLHTYQLTWEWLQNAYGSLFDGLAKGLGDKFIVTGVDNVAGNYSEGLVVVNGELLPFTGGPALTYVTVETIITQEQFDDGQLKDTYTIRRAKFVAVSGAGAFLFTELKRLPYAGGVAANITTLQKLVQSIIGFENEIILSGCLVTNVNTGASTLDISAGSVLFGESVITTPAYSGTYPVYLTNAGLYTTVLPGANFITFNPHTSQRYVDVMRRAMTPAGEIKMFETLTDRFNAGVGRWEMKGFELVSALQNRVPVGLWYDGVAVNNVSDAINTTTGIKGGTNKHTLSSSELPNFTISIPGKTGGDNNDNNNQAELAGGDKNLGEVAFNFNLNVPYSRGKSVGQYDQPHENRQPNTIVVYAKRVI